MPRTPLNPQQPPEEFSAAVAAAPSAPAAPDATEPPSRLLWAMLLSLLTAFALSQAFRTVTSIMA